MEGTREVMPVLVTGGTGMPGRRVVPRLQAAGRDVRVLTRCHVPDHDGVHYVTGDLLSNEGIDAAVEGVSAIVHCAGNARDDATMTQTLVRAVAAQAATPHLVFISVVGADRVPVSRIDRLLFFYFQNKLAAEQVVADSGLPWTTLRATQFYDLIPLVARGLTKLPIVPVPVGFRFQPVDTDRDNNHTMPSEAPHGVGRVAHRALDSSTAADTAVSWGRSSPRNPTGQSQ